MSRLRLAFFAVLLVALLAPSAAAEEIGEHSPNMTFVKNLPYEARHPHGALGSTTENYGTDIEFAQVRGRRYALAGSYYNGLQIVDITRPGTARRVAVYDCAVTQGDVQVFRQRDLPGRVFATYTSDTYGNVDSDCYRQARGLGYAVDRSPSATDRTNNGRNGTFVLEITNPAKPRTIAFVPVGQGSHNMTVHPSGEWLYNSNADLMTSFAPAIEVFDIRNPYRPDPRARELSFPARPGLGTESHDITFNESGDRAYSAALSHELVLDTSEPGAPEIVSQFDDEAINVWHQSDPFTLRLPDGSEREFLIAEDEFAGAAGGPVCPSGGVHVYDITGDKERDPDKVGYWNVEDVGPTSNPEGTCTAHVLDIHEKQKLMTIAFYNGGVRVVDLSGLADGEGLKEIGSYRADDADTWAAKTPGFDKHGDFYLYGNDMARGLDVYRFDAQGERSEAPGRWFEGGQVGRRSASGTPAAPQLRTRLFCLVGR